MCLTSLVKLKYLLPNCSLKQLDQFTLQQWQPGHRGKGEAWEADVTHLQRPCAQGSKVLSKRT